MSSYFFAKIRVIYSNPYTKLALALIAFASIYYSAHYLILELDPITVGFFRYFTASIILLVIFTKYRGSIVSYAPAKNNHWLLFRTGVIGIGIYNILFFTTEKYLPPNIIAIIFALNPCLTALFASFILKQRLSIIAYAGMIVALTGAVGVINYATPSCNSFFCYNTLGNLSKGHLFSLLLVVAASLFNIMNRQASIKKIDSLAITTYAAIYGTVLLFICAVIWGHLGDFFHQRLAFWLAFIYTATIGSSMAYVWFTEAISKLGVSKVAVSINCVPFFTIIIGFLFFQQPITWYQLICGMVIIAGVLITNLATNSRK